MFIAHRKLLIEHLTRFTDGLFQPKLIDFPQLTPAESHSIRLLQHMATSLIHALEKEGSSIVNFVLSEAELASIFDCSPSSLASRSDEPLESSFSSGLAGILLSYPAIYHSTRLDSTATDKDLDVYSVYTDSPRRQVLMQFSAPLDFQGEVKIKLETIISEWKVRLTQISEGLFQKWQEYTGGGGESCTFKIQIETHRVPIMSL